MKKRERLELIKKIVLENDIETQNELVRLLEKEGLQATQATISRDINEVGIIKVPTANGRYIYGLSKGNTRKEASAPKPTENSIKAVSDEISGLENFLHIDVVPGTSYLLKRFLLEQFEGLIFSLIADDNSLLLLAKSPKDSDRIRQEIKTWMKD
ncbi:arginine repressor [Streptococcus ratti]|uniref:Arginine repressor n=2 Tax=Streptococcus ratti TaxID=1341 RepID=A0A7X9QFE8_STRRT|nr:ArgR family transcriptional regulator [Streptococcus ratti]VEI60660.1 arginine repressor [Streptococcus mutans]EJN94374.1 putative arginine repressor [Streptococcus ratti FA-1 = DSM 20564]EMP71050.1 putative arginine repressor [Streptococcus ratti FA-1 = DSM 20564]NMD48641.1 ArgR family transcriptional regulator [Streptococcus ratti]QEY06316.1 ArgR family transcriptional regulator [Streptococcus ratti]